ncbi:MAG: hypothetical protein MPN21_24790 [Thermoanaerobaculia bacterium]|nr:hypothetical protein [Thermoanaerobaculia bacterium]
MIRVSAPGKAILMGEHAAVYGRPALVAALDRRVYVEIEEVGSGPAGWVDLELPELGIRRRDTWEELSDHASRVRAAWRRLHSGIDPEGAELSEIAEREDRSQLARIAVGEALEALDESARDSIARRDIELRIRSEFPVGSGFGSSAAIAAAVVRAVFELAERAIDDEALHAVSLEVERRQHGSPSGVDNATVIHGGILWVAPDERGQDRRSLAITPLPIDAGRDVLACLEVYQTGEPSESTGEVVSAVRTLRARDARVFGNRLDAMEETATEFRRALSDDGRDRDARLAEAILAMRRFESCLEALGVVPEPVRECIRCIEASGGAAKISGAGSLTGPGAGSLLTLHPRPETLAGLGALSEYEQLEVRLGGDGLRLETSRGGAD